MKKPKSGVIFATSASVLLNGSTKSFGDFYVFRGGVTTGGKGGGFSDFDVLFIFRFTVSSYRSGHS